MSRVARPLMMATGIGHAVVGAVLFSAPLGAMARAGFINSIQRECWTRIAARVL